MDNILNMTREEAVKRVSNLEDIAAINVSLIEQLALKAGIDKQKMDEIEKQFDYKNENDSFSGYRSMYSYHKRIHDFLAKYKMIAMLDKEIVELNAEQKKLIEQFGINNSEIEPFNENKIKAIMKGKIAEISGKLSLEKLKNKVYSECYKKIKSDKEATEIRDKEFSAAANLATKIINNGGLKDELFVPAVSEVENALSAIRKSAAALKKSTIYDGVRRNISKVSFFNGFRTKKESNKNLFEVDGKEYVIEKKGLKGALSNLAKAIMEHKLNKAEAIVDKEIEPTFKDSMSEVISEAEKSDDVIDLDDIMNGDLENDISEEKTSDMQAESSMSPDRFKEIENMMIERKILDGPLTFGIDNNGVFDERIYNKEFMNQIAMGISTLVMSGVILPEEQKQFIAFARRKYDENRVNNKAAVMSSDLPKEQKVLPAASDSLKNVNDNGMNKYYSELEKSRNKYEELQKQKNQMFNKWKNEQLDEYFDKNIRPNLGTKEEYEANRERLGLTESYEEYVAKERANINEMEAIDPTAFKLPQEFSWELNGAKFSAELDGRTLKHQEELRRKEVSNKKDYDKVAEEINQRGLDAQKISQVKEAVESHYADSFSRDNFTDEELLSMYDGFVENGIISGVPGRIQNSQKSR